MQARVAALQPVSELKLSQDDAGSRMMSEMVLVADLVQLRVWAIAKP